MGASYSNLSTVTPPATPRARSPATRGHDQDREDRRAERQESRRRNTTEPVGIHSRITCCETTLKEHHDELSTQRLLIQQLTTEMERMIAGKTSTDSRLNYVFSPVDAKVTEAMGQIKEHADLTNARLDSLMSTLNQITSTVGPRLDLLYMEVESLKQRPQVQQVGLTTHSEAPSPTPMPPQSWSVPEPPPGVYPRACDFGQAPTAAHSTDNMGQANFQADVRQSTFGTRGTTTTFHNIGSPLSGGHGSEELGGANPHDGGASQLGQGSPASPNVGGWAPARAPNSSPLTRTYGPSRAERSQKSCEHMMARWLTTTIGVVAFATTLSA